MKSMKKTAAGFTLVEMIVVIAVIGVLAAILVPTMMGYTKKAKHAAANANAKSLLNAGMLACREAEVVKPIPAGFYSKDGGLDFDSNAIANATMNEYIGQHFAMIDNCIWAVNVQSDVVVAACVSDTVDSPYVGTYPHPNQESADSLRKLGSFGPALKFGQTGSWT